MKKLIITLILIVVALIISGCPMEGCEDSDGGRNYYEMGYTYDPNGSFESPMDYCLDDSYLVEYFCENSESNFVEYNCASEGLICREGACRALQKCSEQGGTICEEYKVCDGSKLDASDSERCCLGGCKLPTSFDWRNRHGENWMTPVRDQGNLGACYIFGAIGAMEAQINLYYNQHIDADLSEQMMQDCHSCCPPPEYCEDCIQEFRNPEECTNNCGTTSTLFCRFSAHGIVEEECDPYEALGGRECTTDYVCEEWENKIWKSSGHEIYVLYNWGEIKPDCEENITQISEEELKQLLITKGPLTSGLGTRFYVGHAMALAGYEESNGETEWIFKNSWGENYGENGYLRDTNSHDFNPMFLATGPFVSPENQNYEIDCVDNDRDNFCNWGITENRPASCPKSCKEEKDWDDSNPKIGALGFYN